MKVKIALFGWNCHAEWEWFPVAEGSSQAEDPDYFRATNWIEVEFTERGNEAIAERVQNLDKKREGEIKDHVRRMAGFAEAKAKIQSLTFIPQEKKDVPERPVSEGPRTSGTEDFDDDIPF